MFEDVEQGTDAWKQLRLGKVTASRMADVTARTKSGWGASRATYMAELLIERLTGQPAPSYENEAMRWGKEQEPVARAEYAFLNDVDVDEVGFIHHPKIDKAGASPDGLVKKHGLVEFKCPTSAQHIATLLGEPIADKYVKQMQWQMACCGRDWCDFMSFDPRMPPSMQKFIKRIERDDKLIQQLEIEVIDFLTELEAKEQLLRERYEEKAAAA